MSYVQQTLGKNETIIYRARFNWTYDIGAWFWLLLGAVPLLLVAALSLENPPEHINELAPLLFMCAAPLVIGFGIWLALMVRKWTTEIVVTSLRFVMKTGLISRKTEEVNLNKIEEVNLEQSFWGRVFGYGNLTIRGTGVGVFKLPALDDPIKLRRKLQDSKANLQNSS
ncbi:MAG: PH domain-containing protein [Pseudomonadota bacterium]